MEAESLFGSPRVIAADRWKKSELLDGLDDAGMGHLSLSLLWRGQGFKDGSHDLRLFMKSVLEDKVHIKPSLLLASAVSHGRIRVDDAGNRKLI